METCNTKCCPIENALHYIGKKWSINILRDLFRGKTRFSEFLESNKDLSTKMLSARLKDLEKVKLIEKKVVSTSPVTVEYHLTKKGKGLNRILFEIALFSLTHCSDEVLAKKGGREKVVKDLKKMLAIA